MPLHRRSNTVLNDYLYLLRRADIRQAKHFCSRLTGVVVDIGCGYRPYRRFLPARVKYVGIEYDAGRGPDVCGSAIELPISSMSADAIMCNHLIEHLPEPRDALAEIARVLKPGGLLYLTVPQTWGLHYEPHDYYRFTKYGLEYLICSAQMDVVACEQMGGLFSHFIVRLFDMFVTQVMFPFCDVVHLKRDRYRLAALILAPLTLMAIPIVSLLDRLDHTNVYAWAMLARRRAKATSSARTA